MLNRHFLASSALGFLLAACASPTHSPASRYCKPTDSCWPNRAEWEELATSLKGGLEKPQPSSGTHNPYALEDESGATESKGWLGAWSAAPSTYAVAAENAQDVAAAVNFAREHRLKLVIKSTGHDYLGRSSAPDSLLVWTHPMREIKVTDSFVPTGCSNKGVPAVSLGAGTRWLEAYHEVTVIHHRYVQGGGCASVGTSGGFMQGGGFGSWSKKYGIAAANMLEAEVVTADGKVLIANSCQNQDLFWALRGGGGGTFGVVSRVTLQTYPLPKQFGSVNGSLSATSDDDFKRLLRRFLLFMSHHLNNSHWGEQVRVTAHNSIELSLVFDGITADAAKEDFDSLQKWVDKLPDHVKMKTHFHDFPAEKMWDYKFFRESAPKAIKEDDRPGQPEDMFWWSGDDAQIGAYWYAYASRWIPARSLEDRNLANALFEASRHHGFSLHLNKGQAGASQEAVQRGKDTAMNPAVFDAAALLIMGASADGTPDPAEGAKQKSAVDAAMALIRKATPESGSYSNEADYFEPNWQQSFWGDNYARLLEIKHKVDPKGLFQCHHCVGSDEP